MQYSEGRLGRVFVVRIDDGEDFLAIMHDFIRNKAVQDRDHPFSRRPQAGTDGDRSRGSGTFPPIRILSCLKEAGRWWASALSSPGDDGPFIHYHASVGRAGHALTGCLREKAVTYIVAEAIVLEFTGLDIRRQFDEKTQVILPVHKRDEATLKSPPPGTESTPAEEPEPKDEMVAKDEEDTGGLAEIIRDLTRRPRA